MVEELQPQDLRRDCKLARDLDVLPARGGVVPPANVIDVLEEAADSLYAALHRAEDEGTFATDPAGQPPP